MVIDVCQTVLHLLKFRGERRWEGVYRIDAVMHGSVKLIAVPDLLAQCPADLLQV